MSVLRMSATSLAGGLSTRQTSLLWMLAVAAEKGMPLVDEIDALADDASGSQRRRLRDLADMLRSGLPLPEAVQNIPGLLPQQVIFAVRTGCETGRLGPALRSAAESLSSDYQDEQHGNKVYLFYCAVVLFFLLAITNFLLFYIVPKFEVIFRDFGVELPRSTRLLIESSHVVVNFGLLIFPLIFFGVLALFLISTLGMFGGVRFLEIPQFVIRFYPRLETPTLLRNMSLVIDTGKPLVDAISLAAYFYPRPVLRRILSQIEVGVRHGDDCFQQLHDHRLITKSETLLLRSAERLGNLSWAMRQLADNLQRRKWYRFRLVMEFVKPVVIFCFGLLVLGFAVSFFMPLVALLTNIVETSNF